MDPGSRGGADISSRGEQGPGDGAFNCTKVFGEAARTTQYRLSKVRADCELGHCRLGGGGRIKDEVSWEYEEDQPACFHVEIWNVLLLWLVPQRHRVGIRVQGRVRESMLTRVSLAAGWVWYEAWQKQAVGKVIRRGFRYLSVYVEACSGDGVRTQGGERGEKDGRAELLCCDVAVPALHVPSSACSGKRLRPSGNALQTASLAPLALAAAACGRSVVPPNAPRAGPTHAASPFLLVSG